MNRWDWKLPSKHGGAYYYSKLLINVPFRSSIPSAFITPPPQAGDTVTAANANGNSSGSLREECVLRGLIDGDDEAATVAADARARHFTPEQVLSMLAAEAEYRTTTDAVTDAMAGEDAPELGEPENPIVHETADERAAIAAAFEDNDGACPNVPFVDEDHVWHEPLPDGSLFTMRVTVPHDVVLGNTFIVNPPSGPPVTVTASGPAESVMTLQLPRCAHVPLNEEQYDAYERLKSAGDRLLRRASPPYDHLGHCVSPFLRTRRQLLAFLSGQAGTGKTTLIRLLTQYWRSQGLRVLLTASSGKAARLIGGFTVHSAFKLHENGMFLRSALEGAQGTAHFKKLATFDIIVIDEISMLTATAFTSVHLALNYIVTRSTTQRGHMVFGRKSVVAVGDLYQLPAVERIMYAEQIYTAMLWSEFRFLELTKIMRLDPEEVAFAELLSRARRGWQHLTDADWLLLESRMCVNHCNAPVAFVDKQQVRPPGGRRTDERTISQTTWHCPCAGPTRAADGTVDYECAPCVLASRRSKIEELNAVYGAGVAQGGVASVRLDAIDTAGGRAVTRATERATISDRMSGLPTSLDVFVGQLLLVTVNRRRTHAGYVNGSLAVVEELSPAHAPTEIVLRLLDEPVDAPRLRVRRVEATKTIAGVEYKRSMFPLIPAFAMTVHRVQGGTLTGPVHILMNQEIFAEGQARATSPIRGCPFPPPSPTCPTHHLHPRCSRHSPPARRRLPLHHQPHRHHPAHHRRRPRPPPLPQPPHSCTRTTHTRAYHTAGRLTHAPGRPAM